MEWRYSWSTTFHRLLRFFMRKVETTAQPEFGILSPITPQSPRLLETTDMSLCVRPTTEACDAFGGMKDLRRLLAW